VCSTSTDPMGKEAFDLNHVPPLASSLKEGAAEAFLSLPMSCCSERYDGEKTEMRFVRPASVKARWDGEYIFPHDDKPGGTLRPGMGLHEGRMEVSSLADMAADRIDPFTMLSSFMEDNQACYGQLDSSEGAAASEARKADVRSFPPNFVADSGNSTILYNAVHGNMLLDDQVANTKEKENTIHSLMLRLRTLSLQKGRSSKYLGCPLKGSSRDCQTAEGHTDPEAG